MRETAAVNETEKQVDPVCGMRVTPEETERVAEYQGRRYLFCAEACRRAFVKNPESYLADKPPKKKAGGAGTWQGLAARTRRLSGLPDRSATRRALTLLFAPGGNDMAIPASHPAKAASRGGNPCGRMLEETLTSAARDSLGTWNREGLENAAVGPVNSEEPAKRHCLGAFAAESPPGRRTVRAAGSGIHLVETLPVQGMRCPSCARKVKAALVGCPGVMRAEVSLASGQATVRFDPNRSSLDELKAAVRAAGYGTASNGNHDGLEPKRVSGVGGEKK